MNEANKLTAESNKLDSDMTTLVKEVYQIGYNSKKAPQALAMLAEYGVKLDKMISNTEAEIALYDEIASLDVSEEYKEYAGKLKTASKMEIEMYEADAQLLDKLLIVYDSKKLASLDAKALAALEKDMVDLTQKENELRQRVGQQQRAADKYFDDNQLGE